MEKNNIFKGALILVGILILSFGIVKIKDSFYTPSGASLEPVGKATKETKVREFSLIARQFNFEPSVIEVKKGDKVKLKIKSLDVTHGISLPAFGINKRLPPGREVEVNFLADKEGEFGFACSVTCGAGHSRMKGKLRVI